jgi:hypothetical protein
VTPCLLAVYNIPTRVKDRFVIGPYGLGSRSKRNVHVHETRDICALAMLKRANMETSTLPLGIAIGAKVK